LKLLGISALLSAYIGTRPEELEECLQSIHAQTLHADEVVLLFDGPVKGMVREIVSQYRETLNIRNIVFPTQRGLGLALRDGVQACQFDYIARVDTDDVSVPTRFQVQVEFMESHPQISVVGGALAERYVWGSKEHVRVRRLPAKPAELKRYALYRNPLNHQTVLMRRQDVVAAGNYVHCPWFEDYHLWARILASGGKVANLDAVLASTAVEADYFRRRGGLDYLKAEINLIGHFNTMQFQSRAQSLRFLLPRVPARLLPVKFRAWCYFQILRDRE
jgi:amylovoran biosynthesis glycosyltransferase AmsE